MDDCKAWVIGTLRDWDLTFDNIDPDTDEMEVTNISYLIAQLENSIMSKEDYEKVLFYLWQALVFKGSSEAEGFLRGLLCAKSILLHSKSSKQALSRVCGAIVQAKIGLGQGGLVKNEKV